MTREEERSPGTWAPVSPDGEPLRLDSVEILEVELAMSDPFVGAAMAERSKRALLVRVDAGGITGWGECPLPSSPHYSEEWLGCGAASLERFLIPALVAAGELASPGEVPARLEGVRGHPIAKSGIEAAVIDAWCRRASTRLVDWLGGEAEKVRCGAVLGMADPSRTCETASRLLAQGYCRLKVKISPAAGLESAAALSAAFPGVEIWADANGSFGHACEAELSRLDEAGLSLVEQPLLPEQWLDNAALGRSLVTPICLDEPIRTPQDVALAGHLGSTRSVNLKPARMGGVTRARQALDVARAQGMGAWVGGMIETGIGRAVSVALAAQSGITAPGDISASDRYFEADLTAEAHLGPEGTMALPAGAGIGVEPLADRLREATRRRVSTWRRT